MPLKPVEKQAYLGGIELKFPIFARPIDFCGDYYKA